MGFVDKCDSVIGQLGWSDIIDENLTTTRKISIVFLAERYITETIFYLAKRHNFHFSTTTGEANDVESSEESDESDKTFNEVVIDDHSSVVSSSEESDESHETLNEVVIDDHSSVVSSEGSGSNDSI
eukprot:TCONS_00069614-protein